MELLMAGNLSLPSSARRVLMAATVLAAGLSLAPAPANAGIVNLFYDLGVMSSSTASACSSDCVLGGNEQTFTTGGISIGIDAYSGASGIYVTQKPGNFNAAGGESGLGMSTTSPALSNGDGEVLPGTYILLNVAAARAAGYQLTGVWVESMQAGENAQIYGYNGTFSKTTLNTAILGTGTAPLLGTMTGGSDAASLTQEIVPTSFYAPTGYNYIANAALNTFNYIVITAFGTASAPDISIAALNVSNTVLPTPEPTSMALLASSLAGLVATTRRRRRS